ncbi:FAD-dependent oxidoreductase [Nonomuraea jiangxiensis]|uniref:2-polyprenyl-6-methoxyphenol hydroxylase n=1 Tax=Nonomuraea jiangxiensis TaxID=633440 RepID=A0A1G9RC18_9ACTN|nr:FAD-dependent oxidoreductase [Nonomuraea jiangxiensis]SDM20849.1 2-polyprenyl-6-methoxyphenol hydroxylase [Nonomuraea jiangxiensis]
MDYEVIISGGGPVGLMLAYELGLHGVSVAVLERLTEVDETIKAGAINVPTAEALDRRGLIPDLRAAMERNREAFLEIMRRRSGGAVAPPPAAARFAGHFAGIWLLADRIDASDPDFAGRGEGVLGGVRQQDIEALLEERVTALGVKVMRGVEVTGLEARADGVTVLAGERRFECGWLVGCDGGRSLVRRLSGFEFPGTPPEITGHQAMVEMEDAEGLAFGWTRTDTGVYVNGPIPGRILTVEYGGPPDDRDTPVTAAELQASLRHVSGVDVTITGVVSATRFTDHARQATTYRLGRVLLAGDAAHVHSPFGGQGLNLGIGDAVNLGWKLAAVARGRAPESLLDTYTAERHPIGAWVLDWTRAQVLLMRPEPRARALRGIVSDLIDTSAGTTYFVKRISGLWQRYDLPGEHPLVGTTVPELALADGSRPADYLHDGRGLLLDLGAVPAGAGDGRVRRVTTTCPDRPDLGGLLVRPDGVVAWAGTGGPSLEEALAAWFPAA